MVVSINELNIILFWKLMFRRSFILLYDLQPQRSEVFIIFHIFSKHRQALRNLKNVKNLISSNIHIIDLELSKWIGTCFLTCIPNLPGLYLARPNWPSLMAFTIISPKLNVIDLVWPILIIDWPVDPYIIIWLGYILI